MGVRGYGAALLLTLALIIISAAAPAQAQSGERCFTETGQCISGEIRGFWERNGGLAVFGFPIGPQQGVVGEDGQSRQAQWFERHRIELHPEQPAPYNVQLGRIGVERLGQQGRDGASFPPLNPNNADAERCRFFGESNHQVCGEFLAAFNRYGLSFPNTPGTSFAESLALFGLPLSEATQETIDGKEYTVQWFERARFELHPENQPPFNVLFGRLGAETGSGGAAAGPLAGTSWELEAYGDPASPTPAASNPATMTFDSERVAGTTGCNNFNGSYTLSGSTITPSPLATTRALCTSDSLNRQERAILTVFSAPLSYLIVGDTLRLIAGDGLQALTYKAAPQAAVTGTIRYLQRSALPPEAVIDVQLVDVSRADAPATVISSQRIVAGGRQVPFAFELPYDLATIDPRFTYAVQARITIDGRLRFISTQAYQVITGGNPTSGVDVIVEPV